MKFKDPIYLCRWQGRGEVCGWGWAMTPERPESLRNISCWTSGSAAAPSTVKTWQSTGQCSLYELLFKFTFLLSTVNNQRSSTKLSSASVILYLFLNGLSWMKSRCLSACQTFTVGFSFFPLLGYSLSDMPVKPKRSSLNYSLPITFNKTGELVN